MTNVDADEQGAPFLPKVGGSYQAVLSDAAGGIGFPEMPLATPRLLLYLKVRVPRLGFPV